MDKIKSALLLSLEAEFGPTTLVMQSKDRCMCIRVHRHPDFHIYVRPDDRERSFICHYVHRGDTVHHNNADIMQWMEQGTFQLVRRVDGKLSEFVQCAMWYVRQAVARIESMGEIQCYRAPITFAEARRRERLFPRPRTPENVKK
jgi:hypothetical protein